MSAKNKRKFWKFGVSFVLAANCLSFGCDVPSIEQSPPNSNAGAAVNKSQRFNFAGSNLKPGEINADEANNAGNDNVNNVVNIEMSRAANTEVSEAPQTNPAKKSSANRQFDTAAAQNFNLSKYIVWAFGGKSQLGWYIYKPLICNTLGVENEASDNDFAAGLSRWQTANGLPANGILDEASLAAFVAKWQANRLKVRGYASPNELMIAPAADFYDISRPDELRQVERETYAAYKKLVAAAIADKSLDLQNNGRGELAAPEKFLKIVSAFRSRDYQDKLRRESPNSGRAGLAVGSSPHFTGRALDVYVGGEPVITKDENRAVQVNTKIYRWLIKNAGRFGFKPYFYEPWHWEYAAD